ncbi:hypothetical protein D7S86_04500 [Pararobbsia silviterrae]|uniref:Nucleotidyl transferase AbiEii/AbiGii toxin family protein n=2 Tax=Pararobbsia silviterrae TaxID=1792498 RepID=A0A494Y8Z1_9BURK|nr:hypothetical protein D7S86_04500 [Pararobbsia silviterrae]
MVIGGWCPALRNTTSLTHPGTLDVDLLFYDAYASHSIDTVIQRLLGSGFIPSAKHPFQLMRVQTIRDKDFVFNIDLLHPRMQSDKDKAGMFVDHLDLDVPLTNAEAVSKKMMSIVLPNSEVLFKRALFSREEIDGIPFNLVTFDGMFATKMDSCQKQKRERDAFDIYLGFLGENIDIPAVIKLASDDARIGESLEKFRRHLKKHGEEFDRNVEQYARLDGEAPSRFILRRLDI